MKYLVLFMLLGSVSYAQCAATTCEPQGVSSCYKKKAKMKPCPKRLYTQTIYRDRVKLVEKSVVERQNNRIALHAGYGPTGINQTATTTTVTSELDRGLVGGLSYSRRVLGDVWLGVQGYTNKQVTGSVEVTF